jgi:FAD/FMN-containing dehydrogenase
MATVNQTEPQTFAEVAETLAAATAGGRAVRIRGAGTKLGWGRPTESTAVELSMRGLSEILEHNAGDHTAVLQAGVPLATAQRAFAHAGQRLALDPPWARTRRPPSAASWPPAIQVRCATVSAPRAISSSASPSPSATARSPRRGAR